jgi:Queuosine biosynthesis protein QueC
MHEQGDVSAGGSAMSSMCRRCVLSAQVPGVALDDQGVCSVCREYDEHRAVYDRYFGTESDLWQLLDAARRGARSEQDVALMYSGGKDSTYVLCRLVERGYRVLAITFDNGYVPRACFDNIARVCAHTGVESLVLSLAGGAMNRVFQLSLRHDADVCTGCFRALTARGTEAAHARGIPVVMTGLSRGQIFETKVHPLLQGGVAAPDDIDRCLAELRELYHARGDEVGRLIGDQELAHERALARLRFVDFFRYSVASKSDVMALISARLPFWSKPDNVGSCSSNCMINDVGIAAHLRERGYHSYAVAASWDIRFGHATRAQALAEIEAPLDRERIRRILRVIGR